MNIEFIERNNSLILELDTKNFREGLFLVNAIGTLAESNNHHPKIEMSYSRLVVILFTHETNSITQKDYDLAQKIIELLKGIL